jgi:hypothetical protein
MAAECNEFHSKGGESDVWLCFTGSRLLQY